MEYRDLSLENYHRVLKQLHLYSPSSTTLHQKPTDLNLDLEFLALAPNTFGQFSLG